jgi:hypothetical protein
MRPYEDDLTTTVAPAPSPAAITDPARATDSVASASNMVINRVSILFSVGFAVRVTTGAGDLLRTADPFVTRKD